MTADDVVEAMGEAITAEAAHMGIALPGRVARTLARAAIRALPAGWVVAQVPGFILTEECDATEYHDAAGWNRALAAVRASAVGVDHIAEVSKMVIAESPHGQ